ncbi:diaminopimelate decarboxylase [Pelagibaculum spongiae]|uniref:Diaminopimelate decarboxylase n=1 Tax=Pelagibaculum spongiae TaxID=2080658 RepID=A0A2V1GWQ7_9GAMM|nr:diaminopimelate decarboxylase [Pelagibaculum spongiae]PVZ65626.1 diaminopimelate decarboxylase [Pelagibaculum spongiae]
MSQFEYQNNQLHAERCSLSELAETFGTPLYVYSRKSLSDSYLALERALGEFPHLVCYAVKANSNLGVLSVLAKLGAGFDIVSQGELERVLVAGGDPSRVVFSGVGKRPQEMRRALEVGIHCFNVESSAELTVLNQVAADLGKVANISLRVNPDVDAKTHPYISTGLKENKFGIEFSQAVEVYQTAQAMANLNVVGIDCHIGSQLTELTPFVDAMDRLLVLVDQLAAVGITLKHVDLGGGIGIRYEKGDVPPTADEYAQAIIGKLQGRDLSLVIEPGRSIAGEAGVLLTQVEYLKPTPYHNFAIVDAAMNDLIRPALYSAWQEIVEVVPRSDTEQKQWDIVGPVCETGDFLGKDRALALQQGDLLAVKCAGAYGAAMASNYNTRNRPAEVLVDGEKAHLVRQRETINQQFALESVID